MMFILGYRSENELKELYKQASYLILKGMEDPDYVYIDKRFVL